MKNNGWKSYLCLEIVEKNEQICTEDPTTLGTPALRASVPARGLRPLHRPSLCVVDIFRYFRPCTLQQTSYYVSQQQC